MRTRARLLIAATVLVAVSWLVAGGWRFDRGGTVRTFVVGVALPIVVLFGTIAVMLWTRRATFPAVFDVRDGAFVAPPAHLQVAAQTSAGIALPLFLLGSQLRDFTDGEDSVLTGLAVLIVVLVTFLLLLSVPWVLASFLDLSRVELRPDGLGLFDVNSGYVVPWEAVAVGPTPRVSRWTPNRIRLSRPGLVRRRGVARLWRKVESAPVPQLVAVNPVFLADAVNHYLLHPEHRAAIGTPAEYERLRQALFAAYDR
ncbi:hypothetical protein ACTMTJ_19155 [Phytohabitans sp. LJ34]|uniref:hypothetical protein n=1 Tax=Phytohabitans sp. LJ34 TaxID=3452217 RepID=UPI003F8C6C42